MYEKIKKYYELRMWNEQRVRDAVIKKVITPKKFTEITGMDY